jgi:hypothetical protein
VLNDGLERKEGCCWLLKKNCWFCEFPLSPTESGGSGSSVGSGAATPADEVLAWLGFGAWASMIHPVIKLNMLAIVIQRRSPNLRIFIFTLLIG